MSLVETAGRVLPRHDPEISDVLAADGVTIHTATPVESVMRRGDDAAVRTGSDTIPGQRLLVTVGRSPATRDLGLDAAGVAVDGHGHVETDRHLATSASGIFATGDVTGLSGHTHAAYAMGRVAAGSALQRWRRPAFRTDAIPRVVFTVPEVAAVGVQEHEVADPRARVAYLPMSEVDRAVAADATTGFVKLIAGPRKALGNVRGAR